VQRSSESFAALAAALAKAQAHLVNPEKSLTATIRPGQPGETARSFRYAPLSSGLEIVRKTLSEHEIAVIQTTAVDQASRMLNLTTLLAHSSGEWIASYWPVCSVAEVANPHRMGAALTYARRYALFTLVGIAGEDDLDAPDLCMPAPATGSSTAGSPFPSQPQGNGKVRGAVKTPSPMVLPVDESAALRDRLLSEIAGLASQDGATSWARKALPSKNSLTAADAKLLEDAFEQKLAAFPLAEIAAPVPSGKDSSVSAAGSHEAGPGNSTAPHQPTGIDKSVLAISVPRRYRNKEHLRFVIRQPCLLCGRKPSDPHHLRFVQPRALGRKASDEFAVPLCRTHHRAVHRAGDERAWWKATGIDPLKVARKLWKDTLGNEWHDQPNALQGTQTTIAPNADGLDGKAP
jgi:ERF superfamily